MRLEDDVNKIVAVTIHKILLLLFMPRVLFMLMLKECNVKCMKSVRGRIK